ncbi:MAG: 23S rRNA (uracil(1939)-C(5))-methyltransferase RlmD, partial [Waddliaceae bacterium]|nr:23S rRNA (uracil(1939)-C(5))-methyltransferase RlmD [Waddliaceae bacterium]
HPKDKGTLREVMFREGKNTGDRMAVLTVSGNPDYALVHDDIAAFVEAIRASCEDENHKVSIFIRIQQLVAGKPTEFYEMHLYGPEYVREILDVGDRGAITVNISPAAFFQPNTIQTEKLYALALEHADITEEDVVYDLYCGTGTIGLCVSKAAKKVVGIELSPEAVLDARENIKDNNIENMEVIQGDVGTALADVDDNVDVVIVDPPRSGLDEDAIANILRLRPKKIVYISCNPKTQAKNVADIVAEGYSLTSIQPIDQFPHTPHIENIVIADRKNIDH